MFSCLFWHIQDQEFDMQEQTDTLLDEVFCRL